MPIPDGFPPEDRFRFLHAVYFMYDKNNVLLAMGHTRGPQSSLWYQRRYIEEVTTIKLVWYDDRQECLAALARAALRAKPKYQTRGQLANRDENTGQAICSKCGGIKQRRAAAYCHSCMRVYQKLYRDKHRKRAMVTAPVTEDTPR